MDCGAPAMTSQYSPSGRPVLNSAVQELSSLFIATNATEPREKAIWFEEGETQLESALLDAPRTVLRKPSIPTTAGQRCWQSL